MSSETPAAVSGEAYVRAMDACGSNRRARGAFHALAAELAPAGGRILDFGAGPGVDALHYARQGFEVVAFDTDPLMCTCLRLRCHDEIERGRVTLLEGRYDDFVRSSAPFAGAIDLITANFAPLSMIEDLGALFARFGQLTRPGAKVLASVLNPWSLHDLRYAWWWRNRINYWRAGEFRLAGPGYGIHRRSAAVLARSAGPHFRLMHVQPAMRLAAPWSLPPLRRMWLPATGFMFAIFARN